MEGRIVSIEKALADHGLKSENPHPFLSAQRKFNQTFEPHMAHHAKIDVEEQRDGLLLVKKTFGQGSRQIPFRVAGELADDYVVHVERLQELGVRTAANYNIRVQNENGNGIITVHQILFPFGTLKDWVNQHKDSPEEAIRAIQSSIHDTLMPVMRATNEKVQPEESWIFSDSASKNVAPLPDDDGRMRTFLFDFFVPRIRNEDGTVKIYNAFNLHTRNEEEMQLRFMTKPGIMQNFISKAHSDLLDIGTIWEATTALMACSLNPELNRYFPGKSIDEVAQMKFERNTV